MAENEKIETLSKEEYEVEMEEVLPFATSGSGTMNHALLNNREISNQHPITAIEGLREELDEIKTLKEVFSNQYGHADYYLWADGGNETEDRSGYFVSVCGGDSSKIELYTEGEILGVVVDTAGFIGDKTWAVQTKCNTCGLVMDEHRTVCANTECQSTDVSYVRQPQYGLVATSGVVSVRCGTGVAQGDYVMPNSNGIAAKVENNYGYSVISISNRLGVSYAIIDLGSFKSGAYNLGLAIDAIDERVTANEKNIISAQNTANAAYLQSLENGNISDDAVQKALEALQKANDTASDVTDTVNSIDKTAQNAVEIAEKAKAIAEGAVTEATSLGTNAYNRANDAWAAAGDAREAAYSLCAKIDKYSVGEYSQAYGLTLEQTQSILKPGSIYVPTSSHDESYSYVDEAGDTQEFVRSFTPGYLYRWGLMDSGRYGWVTIDKDHKKTNEGDGDETSATNVSSMSVYFSNTEIAIGDENNYGYWYTNADVISDFNGNTDTYEPYTLYHWEDGSWLAVATLKGNISNRMVSEVYQTTNEIMATVINPRGGIAGFGAKLSDTDAKVNSIASWPTDDGKHNMAVLESKADDDGSYMVLAAVTEAEDGTSKVTELSGAKIVLGQKGEDSSICLDASQIVFKGKAAFTITNDEGETLITGSNITTGCLKSKDYGEPNESTTPYSSSGTSFDLDAGCIRSENFAIDENGNAYFNGELGANAISAIEVTADNVTTGLIKSENYEAPNESTTPYSSSGVAFDLDHNCIRSKNFVINDDGGAIGGWEITEDWIKKEDSNNNLIVGMSSGDISYASLVDGNQTSPARFHAGKLDEVSEPIRTEDLVLESDNVRSVVLENFSPNLSPASEGQQDYTIINAKFLEFSERGVATGSSTLTITPGSSLSGQYYYITTTTKDLLPSTVLEEDIKELKSDVSTISLEYKGEGKVQISGYSTSSSAFDLEITYSYYFDGSSDEVAISFNDTNIAVTLTPKVANATYHISVQYALDTTAPCFRVLEDGSLYASAARIDGNICMSGGRIGDWNIDEKGISKVQETKYMLDSNGDGIEDEEHRIVYSTEIYPDFIYCESKVYESGAQCKNFWTKINGGTITTHVSGTAISNDYPFMNVEFSGKKYGLYIGSDKDGNPQVKVKLN